MLGAIIEGDFIGDCGFEGFAVRLLAAEAVLVIDGTC